MELKALENFAVIAKYENITKAAAELHMAQPPLTRQLRALEQELDVELFVRDKKRLHITAEGRFFKQQCEQLFELLAKSCEQVRQMQNGIAGTVFIGAIETVGTTLLPEWIAGFKQTYPNVKYNLWSANSDDVIERLERGLLDLALIREPYDTAKFDALHIKTEHWIALARAGHPLLRVGGKSASLGEIAAYPLIVPTRRSREISGWFAQAGLRADIMCEFAPLMNAVTLVERGLGVAIAPESAAYALAGRPIETRTITGCDTSSGVSLIWNRARPLSETETRFVQYVQGTLAASLG